MYIYEALGTGKGLIFLEYEQTVRERGSSLCENGLIRE